MFGVLDRRMQEVMRTAFECHVTIERAKKIVAHRERFLRAEISFREWLDNLPAVKFGGRRP